MTEQEQLVAWLDRVRLPYVIRVGVWKPDCVWINREAIYPTPIPDCTMVIFGFDIGNRNNATERLVPGDEFIVRGYDMFHVFRFHPDGRLMESSTWE